MKPIFPLPLANFLHYSALFKKKKKKKKVFKKKKKIEHNYVGA